MQNRQNKQLVKVAVVVNGKYGQYNSHRWKSGAQALSILHEQLKKKGVASPKDIGYRDNQTGKVIGEKEMLSTYHRQGKNQTLQDFINERYTMAQAKPTSAATGRKTLKPRQKSKSPLRQQVMEELKGYFSAKGKSHPNFIRGSLQLDKQTNTKVMEVRGLSATSADGLDTRTCSPDGQSKETITYHVKEDCLYTLHEAKTNQRQYGMRVGQQFSYTTDPTAIVQTFQKEEQASKLAHTLQEARPQVKKILERGISAYGYVFEGIKQNQEAFRENLLQEQMEGYQQLCEVSHRLDQGDDLFSALMAQGKEEVSHFTSIEQLAAANHITPKREYPLPQKGNSSDGDPFRDFGLSPSEDGSDYSRFVAMSNQQIQQALESKDSRALADAFAQRRLVLDYADKNSSFDSSSLSAAVKSLFGANIDAKAYCMGKWPWVFDSKFIERIDQALQNQGGSDNEKDKIRPFIPYVHNPKMDVFSYRGDYPQVNSHKEWFSRLSHLTNTPIEHFARSAMDMVGTKVDLLVGKPIQKTRTKIFGYVKKSTITGDPTVQFVSRQGNPIREQKTAIHETLHSKIPYGVMERGLEEFCVETAAHFGMKQLYPSEQWKSPPSYVREIISVIPQLKKLKEFQHCKTITDFGQEMVNRIFDKDWQGLKTLDKQVKTSDIDLRKSVVRVARHYDNLLPKRPDMLQYVEREVSTQLQNTTEHDREGRDPTLFARLMDGLKNGTITLSQAINSGQFKDVAYLVLICLEEEDEEVANILR